MLIITNYFDQLIIPKKVCTAPNKKHDSFNDYENTGDECCQTQANLANSQSFVNNNVASSTTTTISHFFGELNKPKAADAKLMMTMSFDDSCQTFKMSSPPKKESDEALHEQQQCEGSLPKSLLCIDRAKAQSSENINNYVTNSSFADSSSSVSKFVTEVASTYANTNANSNNNNNNASDANLNKTNSKEMKKKVKRSALAWVGRTVGKYISLSLSILKERTEGFINLHNGASESEKPF